jgi:DNA-binding response OmpR family regulator
METVVAVASEASPVVQALRLAGFRVRLRAVEEPLDELAVHSPDAIVVDVPRGQLASVVEAIRGGPGTEATPLMATIDPELLREAALLKRLTDFCVRPTSKEELAARLRRMVTKPAGATSAGHLEAGGLVIDARGFQASLDGAPLDLAYQEFQLLRFLVSHPNQAFSREQLLARVWGWDYYGGSRTVDIHVRRIRAKLGHPLATWLTTIRHVGYRWTPYASAGDSASDLERMATGDGLDPSTGDPDASP